MAERVDRESAGEVVERAVFESAGSRFVPDEAQAFIVDDVVAALREAGMLCEPAAAAAVTLQLTEQEAHDVHHALSTTVQLMDVVEREPGGIPAHAPLHGARPRLITVAQRLDHERRHKGAVPNPNGPA